MGWPEGKHVHLQWAPSHVYLIEDLWMDHLIAAILYHPALLVRNLVLHPWEVFGCQVNLVIQAPFTQLGCYGIQCLQVGAPSVVYVYLGSHVVCPDQNI